MTTSISALVFTCALALATVQSFLLQFRFSTHSNALLFWSYRLPDGYERRTVSRLQHSSEWRTIRLCARLLLVTTPSSLPMRSEPKKEWREK